MEVRVTSSVGIVTVTVEGSQLPPVQRGMDSNNKRNARGAKKALQTVEGGRKRVEIKNGLEDELPANGDCLTGSQKNLSVPTVNKKVAASKAVSAKTAAGIAVSIRKKSPRKPTAMKGSAKKKGCNKAGDASANVVKPVLKVSSTQSKGKGRKSKAVNAKNVTAKRTKTQIKATVTGFSQSKPAVNLKVADEKATTLKQKGRVTKAASKPLSKSPARQAVRSKTPAKNVAAKRIKTNVGFESDCSEAKRVKLSTISEPSCVSSLPTGTVDTKLMEGNCSYGNANLQDDVCAICLEEPVHPVLLECKHRYCYLCAKGLEQGGDKRCSLCRRPIMAGYLKNPALMLPVLKQEVDGNDGVNDAVHQWFYQAGNLRDWWRFEERNNHDLEEYFKSGVAEFETLICGQMYVVDFVAMVQYRKNGMGRVRNIKRGVKSMEALGVAGLMNV